MKNIALLILGLALLASASLAAAEPAVIIHNPPAQQSPQGESTLNLRNDYGSRCEAVAIGECGSCAISCPVGQAASCKSGKAVNQQEQASCLREPVCRCQ